MGLFSLLSLSFVLALILIYYTNNNKFLSDTYSKNWNTNYIIDIKTVINEPCPSGYDQAVLGLWSGFDKGCYCKGANTGSILVYEKECNTFGGYLSSEYNCQLINPTPYVNITTYRGNTFCVKRSEKSLATVRNVIYTDSDFINSLIGKNDAEILKYIYGAGSLNLKVLSTVIDPNAIVDVKILTNNTFSEADIITFNQIDLSKYEKYQLKGSNTTASFLYIKRLGTISNLKSLQDVTNLIVDIHLYNHLWCGYFDLGMNSIERNLDEYLNKDNIDFGFTYCNRLLTNENIYPQPMFYNDDFKRTERINFINDPKLTKLDFYNENILKVIKGNINNDGIIPGKLEPVLVYEKYFRGFGCKGFDMDTHIKKLKNNGTVRWLSIGTLLCEISSFIISCLYIHFKKNNRDRLVFIMTLIIMSILGLNTFFTFSSLVMSRSTFNYLNDFEFYCQNSFTPSYTSISTNLMELKYKNEMIGPFIFNFTMFLIQALTAIVLFFGMFGFCCCKSSVEDENRKPVRKNSKDIWAEENNRQAFESRRDSKNSSFYSKNSSSIN
jgi:hypothetical protein